MSMDASTVAQEIRATSVPLLEAHHLSKSYARAGLFGRGERKIILNDVSLTIREGERFGLAGGSGCGKSTLARCLALLEPPDCGAISLQGRPVGDIRPSELRVLHPQYQLLFQDAATAMNPRFSAEEIVTEPLVIAGTGSRAERRERVLAMLDSVGLPRSAASRRPREFSGGEKQRLAIARALILKPKLLIFDESLSGLDLEIQSQILQMLLDLQCAYGLAYIFITHDLAFLAGAATEIAVMDQGRIVEQGSPDSLFRSARQERTRALIAAMPTMEPLTRAAGMGGA